MREENGGRECRVIMREEGRKEGGGREGGSDGRHSI